MRQVRGEVLTLEVKPERVKTGALGHVPNPDALVLAVAQNQLLPAHDKVITITMKKGLTLGGRWHS